MRPRALMLALALAAGQAAAQDGIPAAPDTILAVATGLSELRQMIVDCDPANVLPDDDASWATMTDAIEAALWRGRQDPALVTAVLGRLATPAPATADCAVAQFRFSAVGSALPRYSGWPLTALRMFDIIGLPMPDHMPTDDRWQAISTAALAAVEPLRLPHTCTTILMPEYYARTARTLQENADLLAAALIDAGFPPDDVATLAAATGPEALSDLRGKDRAAMQADCVARYAEWRRTAQFGIAPGLPDTVLQALAAP